MAWGRVVQMTVRTQLSRDGNVWTWKDTDISNLHMTFKIDRSIVFNDNSAEFVVYNASENTRNNVLARGSNVRFSAGYSDTGTIGQLFTGNIIDSQSERIGPDWVTTIQAASMRSDEKPFQITPVALSFAKDVPLPTVLESLGSTLGLVVAGIESANFSLPNGFVYVGAIRGALKYCKTILNVNGLDLFIDNSELVVYSLGQASNFTTLFLSPDTGLLNIRSVTDSNDLVRETVQAVLEEGNELDVVAAIADNVQVQEKRVAISAILQPKARPNGLVKVVGTRHDGIYLLEYLTFSGDNFGGDFNSTLEGVATDG